MGIEGLITGGEGGDDGVAARRSVSTHNPWTLLTVSVAFVIACTGVSLSVPDTRHALYHVDSTMAGLGVTEVRNVSES
jgi:hypothetical protein